MIFAKTRYEGINDMFISSFKQIIYFGELFFTRNEIFLLLRNESAHDDNSCKLEKDCLSIHIVTFPRTLNFEFFCM